MAIFSSSLNASTKETIPEGVYVAKVARFEITMKLPIDSEPHVCWEYDLTEGEHSGVKLTDGRRVTDASFPFLLAAVVVIAGRRPGSSEELFDEAANTAGPIKALILGATVKIKISRRDVNGRVFTNIDPVQLILPPGQAGEPS